MSSPARWSPCWATTARARRTTHPDGPRVSAARAGKIIYLGHDVTRAGFRANVKAGMALIPSERFVFPDLTVIENLLLGGANEKDAGNAEDAPRAGVRPVPDLEGAQHAGRGDDVGRAAAHVEPGPAPDGRPAAADARRALARARAPAIVQQIFDRVRQLATDEGLAVLLLEQNVGQALRITDRAYVMRSGRIILEETADEMRQRDSYWDLF